MEQDLITVLTNSYSPGAGTSEITIKNRLQKYREKLIYVNLQL